MGKSALRRKGKEKKRVVEDRWESRDKKGPGQGGEEVSEEKGGRSVRWEKEKERKEKQSKAKERKREGKPGRKKEKKVDISQYQIRLPILCIYGPRVVDYLVYLYQGVCITTLLKAFD